MSTLLRVCSSNFEDCREEGLREESRNKEVRKVVHGSRNSKAFLVQTL
jgi:hypothetical protein